MNSDQAVCRAKRQYGTKDEAKKARPRAQERCGEALRIYRCGVCEYFHFASKRKWATKRKERGLR